MRTPPNFVDAATMMPSAEESLEVRDKELQADQVATLSTGKAAGLLNAPVSQGPQPAASSLGPTHTATAVNIVPETIAIEGDTADDQDHWSADAACRAARKRRRL